MGTQTTLFSLLLLATAGAGCAEVAAEPTSGNAYRYQGEASSYDWIRLRTLNGSISVESTSGSKVEVIAEVSSRRSDPAAIEIVRREGAGGLTFCALWPARSRTCTAEGDYQHSRIEQNDLQVHFRVRVPARARVDLLTVNGRLSLRGGATSVIAKTTNGAIELELAGQTTTDAIVLETTNGAIRVSAPQGSLDADVEARVVNGRIEIGGHAYRRSASARLGGGGRALIARTVNGSIRIGAR